MKQIQILDWFIEDSFALSNFRESGNTKQSTIKKLQVIQDL
jgi:hypothetical protein